MSPILIRQSFPHPSEAGEWSTPDEPTFIARVLEKAEARRMQAPFLVAAPLGEDLAHMIGIPALSGRSGAMVLLDDGTTQFVEAEAGTLIESGTGRTLADELRNRVDLCRAWLERAERCTVEISVVESPTRAALEAWRKAEDAQAAALAAVVAKRTPTNLKRLAKAADARHKAYAALPAFAVTAGVQE